MENDEPIASDPPSIGHDKKDTLDVYTHNFLKIYDHFVLNFACPLLWRCPKSQILSLYNQYNSNNHLDIGVGTGYFLDKSKFPSKNPKITLLDLSENCLRYTALRIKRYQPQTYQADIFETLPLEDRTYDSIAITLLLHCLPGSITDKEKVFDNIVPHLASNGVIFGATVLGKNIKLNYIGKKIMAAYNKHGIFCNLEDDLEGLTEILNKYFRDVVIHQSGATALFVAAI